MSNPDGECVCVFVFLLIFNFFGSYTAEYLLCSKHELLSVMGEVADYVAWGKIRQWLHQVRDLRGWLV